MFRAYWNASWAFVSALLKPSDPIEKECPRGHSILEGWNYCPDCHWIDRGIDQVKLEKSQRALPLKIVLYCYDGNHRGEIVPLMGSEETLGTCVHHTKVLTGNISEQFRVLLSHPAVIISEIPQPFRMNGIESWKETILDYDEVELLGNHFLVLDFQPYLEGQT